MHRALVCGVNTTDIVCVLSWYAARRQCGRAGMVVLIHGPQHASPPATAANSRPTLLSSSYPLPCSSSFILELTAWWIFQGAWSPNQEARNWQSIPDADPENSVVCALT
jgi:hypothetical protein